MTLSAIDPAQIGPSDDDRDVSIARIGWIGGSDPRDIRTLERETAFRDAAVDFGAALQYLVPPGQERERAWIMLEDAFLKGVNAITDPRRPMEA